MIPTPNQIIVAILILAGAYIASVAVMFVLRRSSVVTKRTQTTLDEAIVKVISRPVHLIFLAGGAILALRHMYPDLSYQDYGYEALAVVVFGILGTYGLNRLVRGVLRWYEAHKVENGGSHAGLFGFIDSIVTVAMWGLALLLFLKYFGVDVSALLAGFGIAGVAVAFALQNTLSGLFSTMYLAVDKPLRPGDFVELDEGTTGFVEEVSMRSTRIRTRANNIVIVPNTKLANMVIKNYFLSDRAVRARLEFSVGYDSDLEHAEETAKQLVRDILAEEFDGADEEPTIRFTSFGDSAINGIVIVKVTTFDDQFAVKHKLIKRMKTVFAKEGISMPYPQRDVHLIKDHSSE
jgi:small-conductance mechanosensitive channel